MPEPYRSCSTGHTSSRIISHLAPYYEHPKYKSVNGQPNLSRDDPRGHVSSFIVRGICRQQCGLKILKFPLVAAPFRVRRTFLGTQAKACGYQFFLRFRLKAQFQS